ncbi:MAG: RHS repeat protein [Lachnospiraceae bacterium]|nr:RHS repeat protein [Lachnospiraceae bacterium]
MTQSRKKKGVSRKYFVAGILALVTIVVVAEVLLITGVFSKKDKKDNKDTNKVTPTEAVAKQPTEKVEITQTPTPDPGLVTVYRESRRYFEYTGSPYVGVVMSYDAAGRMTEYVEMDHVGTEYSHVRYEYDDAGRLVKTTRIDTDGSIYETVTRTYNEAGKVVEIIYRPSENQHIAPEREIFEYNGKGQLIREAMYGIEPEILEYEITYQYNEAGLQTDHYWHSAYGDDREHYRYEYDNAGHQVLSAKEQEDGSYKTSTEKKYDARGNVILDVLYDEYGQWVATRMYDYDEAGRMTAKYDMASEDQNPDNYSTKTVYEFGEKGRPIRETMVYRDGGILSDEGFFYDENGCLREDVHYHDDGSVSGTIRYEYMAFSIPYEDLTEEDLIWYNREHGQ